MKKAIASLFLLLSGLSSSAFAEQIKPPVYLWEEPEWFAGVEGGFAYWTGPESAPTAKATGHWGIAGPGISAEWTQGGESEWNSMGASRNETAAECHREVVVPRAGKYRVWVRYVDHRRLTEPFTLKLEQGGKAVVNSEFGVKPIVPENDEYQLYWGFSFSWASVDAELASGPAKLSVVIDKKGEAWRQVDAILVTDDLNFVPHGRSKPGFGYLSAFGQRPEDGSAWRGTNKSMPIGETWKRTQLGGRDFSMWVQIDTPWSKEVAEHADTLTLYDLLFKFGPPPELREAFEKQFAGRKDLPIASWHNIFPGLYLGPTPDLSPESPVRKWLERTKLPFFIMTNYANPVYTDKTGPATYAALTGPLKEQFLGYIHGEAPGTLTIPMAPPAGTPKTDRRAYVDAMGAAQKAAQKVEWSKFYKTDVAAEHYNKGIPCVACESISLAHMWLESGHEVIGYELDATNAHIPMRIAFERGAARQYGRAWINYASGNFGDACNYFWKTPPTPRGSEAWWHSKYSITDGVSIAWYRKMYFMNYLGGASAIYWEQGLGNQWFKPGPGEHPVQESPYGKVTEDFQAFVDRLPDRGEPYTPIAFLLSYGHGYERVNNNCKMLEVFEENAADRELRELFNVAWHPNAISESTPITPDVQSMPNGVYGNIFDVLVDRPGRAKAIINYPVIWPAGDVVLDGEWPALLEDYVKRGGTLVLNVEAVRGNAGLAKLLGVKIGDKRQTFETWSPVDEGGSAHSASSCTPFEVASAELTSAKALATAGKDTPIITRNVVGQGAVILTLIPRMIGLDERAHTALPYLMNGITQGLLPIEVVTADGKPLSGEIAFQVNRTKDGYVVGLFNNRGIDKTQHGVARVDRTQFADVLIRTKQPVKSAKEYTQPRDIAVTKIGDLNEVSVRVEVGDVQVVGVVVK